jgi:transmembrane sensor
MEQKYTPEELIRRYNTGICSDEEKALIESWHLNDLAQSVFEPAEEKISAVNVRMRQAIIAHAQQRSVKYKLWPRIAAAAAILIMLSAGLYTVFRKTTTEKLYVNDVVPGTAKPVLTLANGQKIVLDDQRNGTIAQQGTTVIQRNAAGQLIYTAPDAIGDQSLLNTLTNPAGSKVISLILPDGTVVKLEAASSITYRTAFTGKTRKVSTTGKVYFEVTYNKDKPFFTTTRGQTIEDLGTRFIVDGYDDEPVIKTTLIEGSVNVGKAGKSALLKPGQQAVIQPAENNITVKQADLETETAWINGDLNFHNEKLSNIMKQLARVYDIDVTYKDNAQNLLFYGAVSRSRNLSAILALMESSGRIHFEINGRRVLVITGAR